MTKGTLPSLGPIYFLSTLELQTLQEFVEENIKTSTIWPSQSLDRALVLFVEKKNGDLRLCVDFCGLNKLICKDCYPIPLITDLLDAPKKVRVYTKIDLRNTYHLVRIAKGDKWKTAFCTWYGSFELLVMSFGLSNTPTAFQPFMNEIFGDLLDIYVVVYLDNILIYLNNLEDHQRHVKEVLRQLQVYKLYASPTKCTFHKDSIEFLGFIQGPQGLIIDEQKVQTIQDWPTPRCVKEVQSFLGFSNFYWQFIHNYLGVIASLTHLIWKKTPGTSQKIIRSPLRC